MEITEREQEGWIILSADLHCHTRLSNGSLGIEDLITLAKKRGVETIAITDHDCLAGTVRGKVIGERFGVNVIAGVEISATDKENGQEVHLICYKPDFPDRLEGLCRRNSITRKLAAKKMVLKAARKFAVTPEFVETKCAAGSTNVFDVHIMQALMENGFTDKIHGDLWDELFSPENEGNVLSPVEYEDIFNVLQEIHDAGGIAVLIKPNEIKNEKLIEALIAAGLDGIEVYTPDMPEDKKAEYIKLAKKNKILTTGGSNFKGLYNKNVVSVGDCDLPDECIKELNTYKNKKKKAEKKAAAAK